MSVKGRQPIAADLASVIGKMERGEDIQHDLLDMLTDQLRPIQWEAFEFLREGPRTADELANREQISIQYASSILKDLWEMGLVARTPMLTSSGRYFLYTTSERGRRYWSIDNSA